MNIQTKIKICDDQSFEFQIYFDFYGGASAIFTINNPFEKTLDQWYQLIHAIENKTEYEISFEHRHGNGSIVCDAQQVTFTIILMSPFNDLATSIVISHDHQLVLLDTFMDFLSDPLTVEHYTQ